jgi:serine/threonine protein phosphatase PrpC
MFKSLEIDLENKEIDCYKSGSTSCVAIIKKDQLFLANIGDSRAILS